MSPQKSKIIKVDYLARVEGEGGLYLKIKDREVLDAKLQIFEPPRFFEAFLRGRKFTEAPDITARICGICPIAYMSAASSAMEQICGVHIDSGPLRDLRRLIYCGEWIESHILHTTMLHAPDFLGYQDVIQMGKDHPDVVKNALKLKKIGNDLMVLIGGREIHPVNLKVGGFYSVPTKKDLRSKLDDLKWGLDTTIAVTKLLASFDFPDFERDYEFVALNHPDEYAIWDGRLHSNKGLDIDIADFYECIQEEHVAHSTSLHSVLKERGAYHVGPLARYTLNYHQLTPVARATAKEVGLGSSCYNPFKSIIVRGIETVLAFEESIRLIEGYEMPDAPSVPVEPRAGVGHGCSEAPRGICYHKYEIDEQGIILDAHIAPPTAQNQRTIEEDLYAFVPTHAHLDDEALTWRCEQAIRNYDPCISCSCHFLKLDIERV